VTNSKNSLELIAFCAGAVSAQDVFSCELSCEEANFHKLGFAKWRVWLFFGLFSSVFGFFQQFCWPFLAFFTEGLVFFEKINLSTLSQTAMTS